MSIKLFLILVYGAAGLLIASVTAFMTFFIIEEPIGYKMGSKIVFTVILTIPIIILISSIIGGLFARHINAIALRLQQISQGNYTSNTSDSLIKELATINDESNTLSHEISSLLNSLKKKNEELTMMILTFSHDVRTPLTISNGYLEELEDDLVAKKDLPDIYKKLRKENNFINELCNDILIYQHSKTDTDKEDTSILVYPVAKDVISLLDAPIDNQIDASLSLRFNQADLKRVLLNLLQNALKYAQTKDIKVYNQGHNIIVEDNGIGIDEQYIGKIFDPFYTVDSSKNRQKNGFGLGLAITKNLCQRNQCQVEHDSNYTSGARFILSRSA